MNREIKRTIMKTAWLLAKKIYNDIQSYNHSIVQKIYYNIIQVFSKDNIIDVQELLDASVKDFLSYTLTIAWKQYKEEALVMNQ